jgi:hypothetical protein
LRKLIRARLELHLRFSVFGSCVLCIGIVSTDVPINSERQAVPRSVGTVRDYSLQ